MENNLAKGEYNELSEEEKRNFLDEVNKLCEKSIIIYGFLINQIHEHKMPPVPPAPNVSSSIINGDKIVYEKQKDEKDNKDS